ncbi:MAG TPA: T9SS type A sorting domain-containing protein, partial [Balneolales bacterium]|nr:T9SS type A sorting domain-containing protein [Balneolales bacterium]
DISAYWVNRIFIAQPSITLDSVIVSTDSSFTNFNVLNNNGLNSIDCGDLTGNGKDELILGDENQADVFKVVPNGRYFIPVFKSNSTSPGSDSSVPYSSSVSTSFIKAGDLNLDGKDDIVLMNNRYITNGGSAQQSLNVTVFAVTDTSNYTLTVLATKTNFKPEQTGTTTDFRRHYSLALGTITGFSLGQPKHFVVNSVKQPLVVLNAPPVHFDVFNNKNYDINGCYTDIKNCDFEATYSNSADSQNVMTTHLTSSWGVGASLSGSVSGLGAEVTATMDKNYGENFSKIQNSSYSVTVTVNTEARIEDEICALTSNYDLWEYPVIEDGEVKGHLLVTVPHVPQVAWFSTEFWSSYSYIPDHVPGNVLSYRTYSDSLGNNPYLLQMVRGKLSANYTLDGTSAYGWALDLSHMDNVQQDTTQKYDLNVSGDVTVGKEFGGFGASVKAGVSGDYSQSHLTSHISNLTKTISLSVHLGSINTSLGEVSYKVSDYAYWAKNGALVLDYAVQPVTNGPGGTDTWWQKFYGHAPDPALALPFLYWPEEPIFTAQDPNKITQTQSIYSDPENPKAGDQVTTTVRIHNYSLIPTAGPVQVSFYVGDPDSGGTVIRSISGDSVFSTDSYIPSRGSKTVSFTWTAPQMINSKFIYDGDYTHIYAEVDPENKISEIHENNNKGWSILQVTGVSTPIEKNPADGLPATVKLYPAYPNPFNPTTTIRYELPAVGNVRLAVYDVLGRRVAQLVNSRQAAGNHEVRFNATQMASGLYFYRLQVNNMVRIGKMMLIK